MAIIKAETAQGFSSMPVLKQLGLMIGLAASVALGVAVVMWSQEPAYSLLYGNLSGNDTSQVLDVLQKSNIPFQVDEKSGAVMVAADKIHDARLKLASEGLPKGNGVGFELFDKEQELGTSKFIERARYQHAIEIELARSIVTMRSVKNARIHLAIPKRSVFVRKSDKPTASVVLELYSGHVLSDGQIASVVHMVSSSIPGLMAENITVVDQSGRLLSRVMQNDVMSATTGQFEYTRKLEDSYKHRIEQLLSPIVGPGRVRAQVVADINFSTTEKTRESYNPDMPALRSEQVITESNGGAAGTGGVPGALSNQPPTGGTTNNTAQTTASAVTGGSSNSRTTRNYELDKTISHSKSSAGGIRKLSVAVLVDDLRKEDAGGNVIRTPLNEAAIARLLSLVKDAVGYDSSRGDTVNVINASFYEPPKQEVLPEVGIFEKPWMQNIIKQSLGGLVVLILIFGVLRPVMKSLTAKGANEQQTFNPATGDVGDDQLQLTGGQPAQLGAPDTAENQLAAAKAVVTQDPARVAQVVKTWVANDGG
ncbi:MAG: flagellar basal body M-ring protein FliF [Gammaproteobacteria bacterium]|nr:flagellar basal body M-ring protein FliF [Gammaproteobacteria bacterium]